MEPQKDIAFTEFQRLVAAGTVEKVGAGLYRLAAAESSEFDTLAMVASAAPGGIICLLSALPPWDRDPGAARGLARARPQARKPARLPAKARTVRFSGAMLTYGIETRPIDDARVEQWRAYLTRNALPGAPADFGAAGEVLQKLLVSPWRALAERQSFLDTWAPAGPWAPSEKESIG